MEWRKLVSGVKKEFVDSTTKIVDFTNFLVDFTNFVIETTINCWDSQSDHKFDGFDGDSTRNLEFGKLTMNIVNSTMQNVNMAMNISNSTIKKEISRIISQT